MKLKRIVSAILAAVICVTTLSVGASALNFTVGKTSKTTAYALKAEREDPLSAGVILTYSELYKAYPDATFKVYYKKLLDSKYTLYMTASNAEIVTVYPGSSFATGTFIFRVDAYNKNNIRVAKTKTATVSIKIDFDELKQGLIDSVPILSLLGGMINTRDVTDSLNLLNGAFTKTIKEKYDLYIARIKDFFVVQGKEYDNKRTITLKLMELTEEQVEGIVDTLNYLYGEEDEGIGLEVGKKLTIEDPMFASMKEYGLFNDEESCYPDATCKVTLSSGEDWVMMTYTMNKGE